jgi:hypothetical protein
VPALALAAVIMVVVGGWTPVGAWKPGDAGALRDGTAFRIAGAQLFLADRAGGWSPARDGVYETRDGERLVVRSGRLVADNASPAPGAPSRPRAGGPAGSAPGPAVGAGPRQGGAPVGPPPAVRTPSLAMTGVGAGGEGPGVVVTGALRMTGEGPGQAASVISTGGLTMTGVGP